MLPIVQSLFELAVAAVWPLFFVWLLHKYGADFQTLIRRIRKLGSTGFELDASASAQKADENISSERDLNPKMLKEFLGLARSVAIAEVELALHQNIKDQISKGYMTENDKSDYLIHELAISRLISHFTRIHSVIFGSQIRVLQILNERSKLTINEVRAFFEDAKSSDPAFYGDYKLEEWLEFLRQVHLIYVENREVKITAIGFDFLQFLLATKFNTDKRG